MWKKISERLAYRGWRQIVVKQFELPNGQRAEYDILSSRAFVTIAAFTGQGQAILVRQFRPGPERELLTFCEGAVDPGETPADAARRELLEESGYAAGALVFLKKKNSAYTDQDQYFFLATDCRYVAEPQPDGGEFLVVELVDIAVLQTMLRDPADDTFANIDAAFLALDYLEPEKRGAV